MEVFRPATRPLLWFFIQIAIPRYLVYKNLRTAFDNTHSLATIRGLARGVQHHFAQNFLDCLIQMGDRNHANRLIAIEGIEHLESALRRGNGVIALGAHIGNFVLLGARLGGEGHPFHTLIRLPDDRRIKQMMIDYSPRYYQSIISSHPRRIAVSNILGALKRNEIVHILSDNLKRGKVDTLLFGQGVASPRGPVSLALRSGAPLLPMYVIRNGHGDMRLVIEPEIELMRNGNLAHDIAENTRQVVSYLELLIQRYPDQWNWLTLHIRPPRKQQVHSSI